MEKLSATTHGSVPGRHWRDGPASQRSKLRTSPDQPNHVVKSTYQQVSCAGP